MQIKLKELMCHEVITETPFSQGCHLATWSVPSPPLVQITTPDERVDTVPHVCLEHSLTLLQLRYGLSRRLITDVLRSHSLCRPKGSS